jgi:ribonuclease P protein component
MASSFRPAEHVRQRREFERAYTAGAKVSGRFMTLFAVPNERGMARLGIAATRKMGGAVVRNRAKRRARELFRQHKPHACCDFVVIPRREFVDAAFPSLEREFTALVERATRASGRTRPEPRRARRATAHPRV